MITGWRWGGGGPQRCVPVYASRRPGANCKPRPVREVSLALAPALKEMSLAGAPARAVASVNVHFSASLALANAWLVVMGLCILV